MLVFLLLALLPSVFSLFHSGFYGASDDMHVAWLYEMDRAIGSGQIPPRVVPDLSYRFGYPLFNFVFPLPFYLGEIFHTVGFNFVDSIKIVFGLSLILSGFAMYLLLSEFLPLVFSFAGALLYVFTPYRSTDVYVRGALGESLSFVFIPLIIYALIRLFKKEEYSLKNISLYALSLAGLILTHNIVSYMFFPFVVVLTVLLYLISNKRKVFLLSGLWANLLGLIVSGYFWFPAIVESKLMKYDAVFNFVDHFPTIKQLITPYFGYGASVPGPGDGMSFFMGVANIVIILTGFVVAFLFRKKFSRLEKVIFGWCALILAVSFFMMNFRSSFLWANLPLLPYFQFPWRFLTLVTFVSPLFILPLKYLPKIGKYVAFGMAVLSVVLNVNYFKPHDFLERKDNYFLERYIPKEESLVKYREIMEEYLRLPKGTEKRPDRLFPELYSTVDFTFEKVSHKGMVDNYQVIMLENGELNVSKYYYPGFYAKVDGQKATIIIGKPYGQIALKLDKGIYNLEIGYRETNFRLFFDLLSLAGFTFAVLCLFKGHGRKNKN